MTREAAKTALLALTEPGQMTTAIWEGLGWPFESFLRFASLKTDRATMVLGQMQEMVAR